MEPLEVFHILLFKLGVSGLLKPPFIENSNIIGKYSKNG